MGGNFISGFIYVFLFIACDRNVATAETMRLGIFSIPFNIVLRDSEYVTTVPTEAVTSAVTTVSTALTSSLPGTPKSSSSAVATSSVTHTIMPSTSAATTTSTPAAASSTAAAAASSTQAAAASSVPDSATTGIVPTGQNPMFAVLAPSAIEDLHRWLSEEFSSTTAYIQTGQLIEKQNTGYLLTYEYHVIYNKTKLNDLSLLTPNSTFINELLSVANNITTSRINLTYPFEIDEPATNNSMMSTINNVKSLFSNITWLCNGAYCPTTSTTCQQNATSSQLICSDACAVFEAENSCTKEPSVAGVYVKGTCRLDSQGNPYCDCGMSTGNIMHNFFDGKQCVSVTFIVAMAASAGGFFFILWLIALCVICGLNHSGRDSASSRSSSRKSSNVAAYSNNVYIQGEGHDGMELGYRPNNKEHVYQDASQVTIRDDDISSSVRL